MPSPEEPIDPPSLCQDLPPGPAGGPASSPLPSPIGLGGALWLLVLVALAALALRGLAVTAAAAGMPVLASVAQFVQPFVALALLFVALHLCRVAPLISRLREDTRTFQQLRSKSCQLEEQLAKFEGEIVALRSRVQSESATRDLRSELAETRRANGRLRENERRFRYLAEMAEEGIWTLNPQGLTNFVNRRAAEILGFPIPALLGRSPGDFIHPEELPEHLRGFDLRQGSAPDAFEFQVRGSDGEDRRVRASACCILGEDGDYLGALFLVKSVDSPRVSTPAPSVGPVEPSPDGASRPAEEAQRLREQRLDSASSAVAGFAHELSNALAPVRLATDLLRPEVGEQAQEFLTTLQTCVARGAAVLQQALEFAGGLRSEKVVFNPSGLVKSLAAILPAVLPKHIHIETDLREDLWSIKGSPLQIREALLKLCVCAREGMPTGGTLRVCSRNLRLEEASFELTPRLRPGPYVLIEVQDTGTMIPKGVRERLFEPFYAFGRGAGSEWSLAAVLGIVKSHGGAMAVRSEKRTGTSFSLYLPALG